MPGSARRIELKNHLDARGVISVLEMGNPLNHSDSLPFAVKRIYILHGQSQLEARGAHAHKALRQVIFAMSGQVKIEIDDGQTRQIFHLNSPKQALVLEPVVWRDIEMQPGAVVAVLASEVYDETDYIRNYNDFLNYIGSTKS
jgi:hypothetical protein